MNILNSQALTSLTTQTASPSGPTDITNTGIGGTSLATVAAMDNPIDIPATSASVADTNYMLTCNVLGDNTSAATGIYISYAPVISATGEVLRDQMQQINIPDVYGAITNGNTDVQAVMVALYQLIQNTENNS